MSFKHFFLLFEQELPAQIYYHVTPQYNTDNILRSGLLVQQGERSKQLNEADGVFLFRSVDEAEDAVMNWLGDEFDDDEPLDLLQISLPSTFPLDNDPNSFEVISRLDIPPSFIQLYRSSF